jgi:hypothetical protein
VTLREQLQAFQPGIPLVIARIVTWEELTRHVKSSQEVVGVRPDSLSMRWNGAGTNGIGPQKLVLIDAKLVDLRCVMIVALVCSEHQIPHREALRDSGALIAGGLALKDGAYVLRVSALLDDLRPAQLDAIVEHVANTATELRRRLGKHEKDLSLYSWIQD